MLLSRIVAEYRRHDDIPVRRRGDIGGGGRLSRRNKIVDGEIQRFSPLRLIARIILRAYTNMIPGFGQIVYNGFGVGDLDSAHDIGKLAVGSDLDPISLKAAATDIVHGTVPDHSHGTPVDA